MKALAEQINELDGVQIHGRVVGVRGLMVEVAGSDVTGFSGP
jgi:flagellum-specific ATP synthase